MVEILRNAVVSRTPNYDMPNKLLDAWQARILKERGAKLISSKQFEEVRQAHDSAPTYGLARELTIEHAGN